MAAVAVSSEPGAGVPQLAQKWLVGGTSLEQRAHRAMIWD
jgi:hypothetical protein